MDLHLSGKVFIVTGASVGIGAAVVRVLEDEGATAVGVARKPQHTTDIAADVTDLGAAGLVVDEVLHRHGRRTAWSTTRAGWSRGPASWR
ncbi:hypothetical protein ALI22I_05910 [Saccharothrix sp. ALI-22-I]|uniref:SDR family NAD(P)-dependent oxidoreductase n=1 Tax=Saccharothrix sp. ALI-22-I TaxID=1933778 RepID=UPI00097BD352|nr:SDR family NAD(P)-dependent oxidoreductase [Saccharothrix sp. ALI-22-I]ONI92134.1 hypothetical protein ALI22I_05910 [Saccharothrix sp. ALI-22-I]